MRNLLTDLCVEAEAHTFNAMYMARSFDRYYTASDEVEKELFRIGVRYTHVLIIATLCHC